MGSETKVVPTTSNTQQQVQIPQYLQDAGMAATAKAADYASTPYTPFSGEQVAPLTANQNTAISTAAGGAPGASADMDAARAYLQQAGGNIGTGTGAVDAATQVANQTAGAGMGQADLGATLASLAGTKAAGTTDAGASDLAAARGYNASSAAPVSADQISSYFNPYVQTALDPVLNNITRSSQQTGAGLASKAAMTGAFGGARSTLQQTQNNADLLRQIATTSGAGYSDAYDKALAASQADKARQAAAAGTSISIGAGANTDANDATNRLVTSAAANNDSAKTLSGLADSTQQRFLNLVAPSVSLAGANQDAAKTSSGLAASDSQLTTDQINRLLTTGGVQQTEQQNLDNTAYQQYQNQQDYALKQLNALIAAAGGVPYGTSTTSNTQGTQVVQSPSVFGQIAGAVASGVGAYAASNRDWKEDFEAVDDEDILAKFRNLTVESYNYKPDVAGLIENGAGRKIGPMSGDWGREFHGDPDAKVIAMPEMMGAMVSAVRALEARTRKAA